MEAKTLVDTSETSKFSLNPITTQIMANFQNTDTFLNYCSQLVLWCLSYTDIFELLQWNFHLTLLQLKR